MERQMGQPGGLEVGTRMVCFLDREESDCPDCSDWVERVVK